MFVNKQLSCQNLNSFMMKSVQVSQSQIQQGELKLFYLLMKIILKIYKLLINKKEFLSFCLCVIRNVEFIFIEYTKIKN